MSVTETTDDNFDTDVLQSSKPVVVDFWAEWCGPCKQIAPHLEELASEKDDLKVVKVNVDDNVMTASRFGVRGMPTLMIFKDGKVAATHLGAMSKSRIAEWVAENV
ncbi:MAG: thioredoxin [Hirschia sp.]|nr:thioredoxin [Hirschia sp.]MBF17626.1 thioredoxin [Hirschia sp.]